MANKIELFHGSAIAVEKHSKFYKDFGFGFYCTNVEKQAKRWALSKRANHIVNIYSYTENNKFKILKYEKSYSL